MIAYLEKFLALVERFVVAHELIASNAAKQTAIDEYTAPPAKELPVEGEDVIDTKPAKAKPEPEDDLADDDEPEEKPKQKRTRGQSIKAAAEATKPKGPDVAKLREEIKTIAKAIAAGGSDECADKFDELLEDYKVRTVTKLADEDVEAFHKDATKLVGKYYEIEE